MDAPPAPASPEEGWAERFAEALRVQRTRAREFLAALGERQGRAQADLEAWIERCASGTGEESPGKPPAAERDELALLRDHRDRLEEKLAETEARLERATERLGAMERRLEAAWRDASEEPERSPSNERQRSGLLMQGLSREPPASREVRVPPPERSPAAAARGGPPGGVLDWEAEKRRIVAALEAEGDSGGDSAPKPHEELEQVLRRTDAIVTDKEREISELRQLLQDQSTNLGSVAVGAAALGGILDTDAIVQEERENLRRAQTEWQEKVRNAEIEIAIERAKLARQRAEIEESLRVQGGEARDNDAPASKTERAPSGRWLARLGLKDSKNP